MAATDPALSRHALLNRGLQPARPFAGAGRPLFSVALFAFASGTVAWGAETPDDLCGELRRVDGLPVLRLWGTSQQRGYAHGYLLADRIHDLFGRFLADRRTSGGPEHYQRVSLPLAETTLRVRPIYEREMRAIADGLRDRLGPQAAVVPALGRPIEYRDLLALNALSDYLRPMCSSVAAWGPMTADGSTLTGRNLDWPRHEWMIGQEIVIAQRPSETPRRAGFVAVTWPGFIGCLTGMNERGVTIAIHDVPGPPADRLIGVTPRGLVFREALESAVGSDSADEIAAVFRRRRVLVGSNAFVSWPFDRAASNGAAAVLEYDGRRTEGDGVTIRRPGADENAVGTADQPPSSACLACTNHYRRRGVPAACGRYETLHDALHGRSMAGAKPFDAAAAWALLGEVAAPRYGSTKTADQNGSAVQLRPGPTETSDRARRSAAPADAPGVGADPGGTQTAAPRARRLTLLTYHSVVFEPNQRRLRLAVARPDAPAADRPPTTIDLRAWLSPHGRHTVREDARTGSSAAAGPENGPPK